MKGVEEHPRRRQGVESRFLGDLQNSQVSLLRYRFENVKNGDARKMRTCMNGMACSVKEIETSQDARNKALQNVRVGRTIHTEMPPQHPVRLIHILITRALVSGSGSSNTKRPHSVGNKSLARGRKPRSLTAIKFPCFLSRSRSCD